MLSGRPGGPHEVSKPVSARFAFEWRPGKAAIHPRPRAAARPTSTDAPHDTASTLWYAPGTRVAAAAVVRRAETKVALRNDGRGRYAAGGRLLDRDPHAGSGGTGVRRDDGRRSGALPGYSAGVRIDADDVAVGSAREAPVWREVVVASISAPPRPGSRGLPHGDDNRRGRHDDSRTTAATGWIDDDAATGRSEGEREGDRGDEGSTHGNLSD